MSTVFTISKSWHDSTWLFEQLAFAQRGDAILLIEDAVLALQSPTTLSSFLAKCKHIDVMVFGLLDDVRLRGIDTQCEGVELINYADFVDLVCAHDRQVSW